MEARDHHPACGHQHALGLAQNLVRPGRGFQYMWQHQQIDALRIERQVLGIGNNNGARIGRIVEQYARPAFERDTISAQQIPMRQANLYGMIAKYIAELGRASWRERGWKYV